MQSRDQSVVTTTPPSTWYRIKNALRGTYNKTLTEEDVPSSDLTAKWIVISGANNGIGFEAAKSFARQGANIVLACREPPPWEKHPRQAVEECIAEAAEAGHSSTIEYWELDMADLSSVTSFAERWLKSGRVLDILCNNAGTGVPSAEGKPIITKDGFETIHQVNFLSHVLLTLRLLPSLAQSREPRIVCTTSCNHYLGEFNLEHFNSGPGMRGLAYSNNKLYFQMWITELQLRLSQHESYKHITINGVHPGFVNSGIWVAVSQATNSWPDMVLKFLAGYLAITSQQGALSLVYAVTSPKYGKDSQKPGGSDLDVQGGKYLNRIWEATPMPYCFDAEARLQVWRKLNEELHLQELGLLNIVGV